MEYFNGMLSSIVISIGKCGSHTPNPTNKESILDPIVVNTVFYYMMKFDKEQDAVGQFI